MLSAFRMSASRRLSQITAQTRSASSGTMKEAVVAKGPKVTIRDVPIPKPGPYQVVTKVIYSGSNPKDWKRPQFMPDAEPVNQGDDIAGIVHEVGEHVSEFKPGDRVFAFHEMMKPGGSYAEYALSWSATTAHLPANISFQAGAAIPLAALTAAVGLFARLQLPSPFTPPSAASNKASNDSRPPTPLIIYGAASAVGSYALQLALRANIHPLICVAGKGIPHVESFIDQSKGDTIVDYRDGNEAVVKALKAAADKHGGKIEYAFDAVSEKGSVENLGHVLDQETGRVTFVLPGKKYDLPGKIRQSLTTVGSVHGFPDDLKDFGHVYFRYLAKGLEEGWFKAHPQEVVPGGLQGVETALSNLKQGKASAVKYVFRIADTSGLEGHEKQ
ncbi:Quinone oxidoreductase [Cercospora beticola]|uniref:Quinone oxidoreductase n=1 Tax=Cercospora beticola TaxID=122368 RepID=A0A2G5HA83_CERBT|nr:Quinone oxidoreductase [Cercospora beticola]PIA89431.1 Quinone oxidoreductase [Cercospora beticola]WPB03904.1 hypothetical protein RHO25_008548 [Cercospora beticola]CAK1357313.1 unnamed protein product [Cercospora beticola]